MASQINTTGKNIMLDAIGTGICTHMALYTDAGGTTEVTGGSYARKALTWSAASGGSKSITTTFPVFDVPAGTTVAAVGFMTAVSGGTQHAVDDVTSETFTNAGTYTITSATIALT